jgi:hypothetical protein
MECAAFIRLILLGQIVGQSIAKLSKFIGSWRLSCCRGCRTCQELACIRAGPKAELSIFYYFLRSLLLVIHKIHMSPSSLGRYVFGSEISYNKPPPRLPGLAC